MERLFLRAFAVTIICGGALAANEPVPAVQDKVPDRFAPMPFAGQRIEGLLGERMKVNLEQRLLTVELEPILTAYQRRPGKQTWIGEHAAKFIDAATNVWAYSGDARLKQKLDDAVRQLIATQESNGYLGTYLPENRWKDWDVWAHKYNLIALLNYYRHTGYAPALQASRKMGDLLCREFGDGPGQKNIVVGDWHRGMASSSVLEPMAMLYRWTGEKRYLGFCYYIVHAWDKPEGPKIIQSLMTTGSVRQTANAKAYEMTSNLVGLLDLYRITGDEGLFEPVKRAWQDISTKRLYLTGTASWDELYRDDYELRADDQDLEAGVGEGCVTVTWMQMNWHLFRLTGETKYADELERTIYNALLGAQSPRSGLVCYFVPLNGKRYPGTVHHGVLGVSCCNSSIPRGVSLIPETVWGRREGGLAMAQYTVGQITFRLESGQAVTLHSTTNYPADGAIRLRIESGAPARFPVFLRVPGWSTGFRATAGGRSYDGSPDDWVRIDRQWAPGDTVEVQIDMAARVVSGAPAYANDVAIVRGPQVLALDHALNLQIEPVLAGVQSRTAPTVSLKNAASKLPKDWKGAQAYSLEGYVADLGGTKAAREFLLVPFADAGQSSGEYRVWLTRKLGD